MPLSPRLAVCAAIACGVVACIEPGLVPCGELSCPAASVCVANELCASQEQLDSCAGIADGDACSLATTGNAGRCDRGVCVAAGCGNGTVDPDEACDDGNTTSGDGCRADCRKLEMCGDAVVDDGEGCDDGNANPADRCDACVPTTWRATASIGGSSSAAAIGLGLPTGVATDRYGNLYIADSDNHRVRRIDPAGNVTTVAGTGVLGRSGDGGAATSAMLYEPSGVAIDGLGTLFIADTMNHLIRRVDASGVITTIAGGGTAQIGDNGPATSATLSGPNGVAVDGLGNIYIAETNRDRIRRVDASGIITTFAGGGTSGPGDGGPATAAHLEGPVGVAVDRLGNVYIASRFEGRIRKVDATTGVIETVAGGGTSLGDGGPATSAQLNSPHAVAIDVLGALYIADSSNQRVRRVGSNGIITTIAGTGTGGFGGDGGPATSAQLYFPDGVALDDAGNLYIADTNNNRIRRVDTAQVITTLAGIGSRGETSDGSAATGATLELPDAIAVDGAGNLYIADEDDNRIRRVDAAGTITTFAGSGVFGYSGDGGPATSAQFANPSGLAADGLGNIYIADFGNDRVRRVDAAGNITTVAGTGAPGFNGDNIPATSATLSFPTSVAVDAAGNLYIADGGNDRVRRVDAAGIITTVAGVGTSGFSGDTGPALSAELSSPTGVAVDQVGNLFIGDSNNRRVRRVDTNGIITTFAGTGTSGYSGDGGAATSAMLAYPYRVAVDGVGNVYIADLPNDCIRRVDTNGVITTIAGTGTPGFSGDGGAATSAMLFEPADVAVGAAGALYVADESNGRIRRVDAAGIITTVAGAVSPDGLGVPGQARLADPRAIALAGPLSLVAGGSSGTLQVVRATPAWLEVGVGRYPHPSSTGALARFRDENFGAIGGVAYDAATARIYLTESSSNRLHVVTIVDPDDEDTWTIAPLAGDHADGAAGFANGAALTARFRDPAGLYLDATANELYVADTGNHAIRAIDLSGGLANAAVRTVAGIPGTRGYFGDDGAATAALLHAPRAVTRCGNGDLFIADTGNHRVRRVGGAGSITTVLGDGVAASSGEGTPSRTFPVDAPMGLACDALGNLFVTSTMAVRLVAVDANGVVDGSGEVTTIYGAPPHDSFPASVTRCLTGIAVLDSTGVQVVDSCTGLLVELRRMPQ